MTCSYCQGEMTNRNEEGTLVCSCGAYDEQEHCNCGGDIISKDYPDAYEIVHTCNRCGDSVTSGYADVYGAMSVPWGFTL